MKKGLILDKVVLLGRTFEEYSLYLGLELAELGGKKILDLGSGVSSFCAEALERGLDVLAVDPIYDLPSDVIRARCEPDLDLVTRNIAGLEVYRWNFYKNPEGMRRYREKAYRRFLEDYERARGRRYLSGRLPHLQLKDGTYDLALVSYLLFLYEDQLGYEFHRDSIREVMRVTRGEARIYPLVNFEAQRSHFLDRLKADPELSHLRFEEVPVDFEFLANSNWYLRVQHKRGGSFQG